MKKSLSELVEGSDLLLIGIGSEWNWIRRGIREDGRYSELRSLCRQEGHEPKYGVKRKTQCQQS